MSLTVIAAICAGVILGLWLQGTCICVGLIALAGIVYVINKSTSFYGKSVPVDGKAVLITGCDSGFGKSLAEGLDALGFTVVACCMFPDKGGADYLRQKCSSKLHLVRLDVTKSEEVNTVLEYVKENIQGGSTKLWAIVNNAGISAPGEVEWTDHSTYEKVFAVNVFGTMRVTKAFLPLIREARGRVVNVASMVGRFSLSGFSAYCSSKFACIGFSDGLRREMKKFGVTVHTIEPGFYKTEMTNVEYQMKMTKKAWDQTPEVVREAYTEEYFQAYTDNFVDILTKDVNPNVHEVIDCMVDAVTSELPKMTYAITLRRVIESWVMVLVPTWLQDTMMLEMEPKYSMQTIEN